MHCVHSDVELVRPPRRDPPPEILPLAGYGQEYELMPVFKFSLGDNLQGRNESSNMQKFLSAGTKLV